MAFKLSIHDDIPAVYDDNGNVVEHSRPGLERWSRVFQPGGTDWKWRLYANNVVESFYDPNQDEIIGSDNEVYQYNFYIADNAVDPAFQQEFGRR